MVVYHTAFHSTSTMRILTSMVCRYMFIRKNSSCICFLKRLYSTHTHTCTHTCTCTCTHTHVHTHMHTHSHTHLLTHAHTHTHSHSHTHTLTHTHTLSLSHTHTHTHALQGILDVYRYALSQVQLYGPTNFSSFLDRAIEVSVGSTSQESQSYFILLVITVS